MKESISSHELAKILLAQPNMPVATHANNHTYAGHGDRDSHGPLKVGILHHYSGQHIVIGNISKKQINPPNWYVVDMIHGSAPDNW